MVMRSDAPSLSYQFSVSRTNVIIEVSLAKGFFIIIFLDRGKGIGKKFAIGEWALDGLHSHLRLFILDEFRSDAV